MKFQYDEDAGLPVINGPISHAAARLEALLVSNALRPQPDGSPRSKVEYAQLVESVAKGLFSLAVAGGKEIVQDLTEMPSQIREATYVNWGPRIKLFAPNAFGPSVANLWAAPGNIWGPGGAFNLSAIMLEAGSDRYGPLAELTLVLPVWTASPDPERANWFALVGFNTRGHIREERVRGYVDGSGFAAPVERYQALKCMLGIEKLDGFKCSSTGGYGVTSCLGFPFAEEILAAKAPLLNEYLVGCARKLGEQNT